LGRFDDVVSLVSEPLSKAAAGAPIHQEFHFVTSMA
jgi:hypothetical protein